MKKKALFTIFIALALFVGAFLGGCMESKTKLYSYSDAEISGYDVTLRIMSYQNSVSLDGDFVVSDGASFDILDWEFKSVLGKTGGVNGTYYIKVSRGDSFTLYNLHIVRKKKYKVRFCDGDDVLMTYFVDDGMTTRTPDPPTKDGYVFAGWAEDVNEPIYEDKDFHAVWQEE